MNKKYLYLLLPLSVTALILSTGCAAAKVNKPTGAKPVTNFKLDKYLGKWYEVARFDFFFEKGIHHTTAEYSLNEDGSIKVINSGIKEKNGKLSQKEGKAVPVGDPTVGELKVTFFGPFYSGYNVVSIDGDYEYALVVGRNTDYIWFMSRTPEMPQEIKDKYQRIAKSLGYDLSRLVWVDQK